jgi:hypothetical protein
MTVTFPVRFFNFPRITSIVLLLALFVAPLAAQQPAPVQRPAQTAARAEVPPPFEDLLSADAYKVYGEVRNVGQLLSNGGAAEIVDPIIKLADPGPQFKLLVSFLKKNSEALAQSRLMFASWAVRTDVPVLFVAIEFPTSEDATKFAPKLETFLPTILPPTPVTPEPSPEKQASPNQTEKQPENKIEKPTASPLPKTAASGAAEADLPFIVTRAGTLVCISDKSFKFSKLRPKDSKALFQDQNFRIARDQFSSEPIFVFFNVALEEKAKAKPSPTPFISEAEANRRKAADTDNSPDETPQEAARSRAGIGEPNPDPNRIIEQQTPVLGAMPSPSPTPTPTKEEAAQQIASNQIGHMLDAIGYGDPQWPEAVGLAVALDGNEYILRATMIDKPEAKKVPIPFIPQLIGGPPFTSDAASVLPEDTDVLISASIDLTQTYDGMRKASEVRAKATLDRLHATRQPQVDPAFDALDAFTEFEKKAGFKIKDDLLPAFGREIVVAGSLKTLQGLGGFNLGLRVPTNTGADKDEQSKKQNDVMPVLLIEVRDRDAARKLMPGVLSGLGFGEANLIAQTEKRDDTETVNYAGIFAYAFVGDFLVVSDAGGVRKVVDAYVNHQTLSSNTVFRNSRRWQSNRTVGQIYVSPALMEGYQEGVRKTSATMDPGLRDFLLGLNPTAEAITYALSDDGLGTRHELHLPKNLILMTVASISSATKNPPPETNEAIAIGMLANLSVIENEYKSGPGKGSYGSLQQLSDANLFPANYLEKYAAAYKFEITIQGDQFEAVATPREYGKNGKRSFFVDKTGVVRGDDHGGGPATIADKVVQESAIH